jgi:hypothetical protein
VHVRILMAEQHNDFYRDFMTTLITPEAEGYLAVKIPVLLPPVDLYQTADFYQNCIVRHLGEVPYPPHIVSSCRSR